MIDMSFKTQIKRIFLNKSYNFYPLSIFSSKVAKRKKAKPLKRRFAFTMQL